MVAGNRFPNLAAKVRGWWEIDEKSSDFIGKSGKDGDLPGLAGLFRTALVADHPRQPLASGRCDPPNHARRSQTARRCCLVL